ncbi:NAD(P)-binding protein [Aspergillus pseudoustus]|uniref:NAD(P)-binding protein n=1 Tax=Aspergillus pseudoustus TaxID=1810923 RepID=A0ABR4J0R6_9EURO
MSSPSRPFAIPSLTGKVFLVTGGNTGVGFHTVEQLAKHGARVYMGARSHEKANTAIAKLRADFPDADVQFLQLDHMDLQSIVAAAKQFKSKEAKLHGLVNNAGIMATPFAVSDADGFEAQWQTNYLAHWLLTWHLLDTLSETIRPGGGGDGAVAPGSVRIVNVTSDGHSFAPKVGIDFDDLKQEKGSPFSRYGMSKVANILHAKQLDKLFGPKGSETGTGAESGRGPFWTAAVHPGHLDTNLNKQTAYPKFIHTILKTFGAYSHASEGAYNSLWAVASPDFKESDSGEYFVPGQKRKQPSKVSRDMDLAQRLWDWTHEELGKRKLLD